MLLLLYTYFTNAASCWEDNFTWMLLLLYRHFSYITQMIWSTNFVVMRTFDAKGVALLPFNHWIPPICNEFTHPQPWITKCWDLNPFAGHLTWSCEEFWSVKQKGFVRIMLLSILYHIVTLPCHAPFLLPPSPIKRVQVSYHWIPYKLVILVFSGHCIAHANAKRTKVSMYYSLLILTILYK